MWLCRGTYWQDSVKSDPLRAHIQYTGSPPELEQAIWLPSSPSCLPAALLESVLFRWVMKATLCHTSDVAAVEAGAGFPAG